MTQKSEFDRLEEFVSKLLVQYDKLREKNTELQVILSQKEEDIDNLKAKVSTADSERGDISDRVKGLIDQIEEWELALEETEEQEEEKRKADSETSEDEDDVDDEELLEEEIADDEKEGGLQQNLFNVEPQADENYGG